MIREKLSKAHLFKKKSNVDEIYTCRNISTEVESSAINNSNENAGSKHDDSSDILTERFFHQISLTQTKDPYDANRCLKLNLENHFSSYYVLDANLT
jgi:hypothetical protein